MGERQSVDRGQMARRVCSGCIVRCVVVVAFALLWNQFAGNDGSFRLLEHTFFTAGAILLAAAWFCYLKLDQVRVHHLLEKSEKPRKNPSAGMTDYVETEPDSPDTLSKKQKTVCHLISNLVTGAGFVLISIVVSLFL